MNVPRRRLTILHLLLAMGETSAPYNEHCLARRATRNTAICTLFTPTLVPPEGIALFAGDGSVPGFFRVLTDALDHEAYDIIHAHSCHVGFLFLAARIRWPRQSARVTVFTLHGSYSHYGLRHKVLLLPIFAFFTRVICCGKASFESIPAVFRWLAGRRLGFVPNGLDLDRVDRAVPHPQRGDDHGTFDIVTVGRLIPLKNPLSVLNAFRANADGASRLTYIGEGPLRDELSAQIRSSGLEGQVAITGLVPRNAVYQYLSRADLFVSASRTEGLPVAVLEAMACRCPVILSDIPPHREIADGARFIPLVHPDDIAGFAREMERFRQMAPAERAEIGDMARRLVEGRFGLMTMHRRYEEIYAEALDPGKVLLGPFADAS